MRDDILQPSFADLELMRQGIEMDPVLAQVAAYADQHAELIQAVEQQLENGLKKPKTGRRGLTGAQVKLTQKAGPTPSDIFMIEALRKQITDFCGLGDRVVDQARRRVIDNEQVPAAEKIYSIFEPHTALIKRGKAGKPVEFGHKIYLAETGSGLITQ